MVYDKENIVVSTDGLSYNEIPSSNGYLCPAVYIGEALYTASQSGCTPFGDPVNGTCRSGDFSLVFDGFGKPVLIRLDAVKMQFELKDVKIT